MSDRCVRRHGKVNKQNFARPISSSSSFRLALLEPLSACRNPRRASCALRSTKGCFYTSDKGPRWMPNSRKRGIKAAARRRPRRPAPFVVRSARTSPSTCSAPWTSAKHTVCTFISLRGSDRRRSRKSGHSAAAGSEGRRAAHRGSGFSHSFPLLCRVSCATLCPSQRRRASC